MRLETLRREIILSAVLQSPIESNSGVQRNPFNYIELNEHKGAAPCLTFDFLWILRLNTTTQPWICAFRRGRNTHCWVLPHGSRRLADFAKHFRELTEPSAAV